MSTYEEYVKEYGVDAIADTLENEGICYGVIDYYGADFFVGSPIEKAARAFKDARDEIEEWAFGTKGLR